MCEYRACGVGDPDGDWVWYMQCGNNVAGTELIWSYLKVTARRRGDCDYFTTHAPAAHSTVLPSHGSMKHVTDGPEQIGSGSVAFNPRHLHGSVAQ